MFTKAVANVAATIAVLCATASPFAQAPPAFATSRGDAILPFKIQVPDAVLRNLKARLKNTRLAEPIPNTGWDYGTRAKPFTADMISHVEALVLARSGRLQDARLTFTVAVDIAMQRGQRERAASFQAATAVWEGFYGNATAARQRAIRTLELAGGRDGDYAAPFALALSGEKNADPDIPVLKAARAEYARLPTPMN